jgi:hypothetical protein
LAPCPHCISAHPFGLTFNLALHTIEQDKALDHTGELLTAHWREEQNAQDEDGKSVA